MSLPMLLAKRVGTQMALSQVSRNLSLSSANAAGYWNKDWRPNEKLPETEEEKRAAAKKYGLIREDYEPYPDDGTGFGDYPKLPLISAESRDPHAIYDFPELKRNFNEPMHVEFDMVGEDRWDYNKRLPIPIHKMLLIFLSVMGGTGFLAWCSQYFRIIPVRKMPRHMLYDGKTHYTYELEDVE